MGQRTDTRDRIIAGAMTAIRSKGFTGASISEIVTASGAPRGSVTFHFPGGKDQIADEVVALRTAQVLAGVDRAAERSASAADLLSNAVTQVAEDLDSTGFALGCPVLPIAIERSGDSVALREAGRRFYAAWRERLALRLGERGVEPGRAARVATLAVSAIEGALAIGRVERTRAALEDVRVELVGLVA